MTRHIIVLGFENPYGAEAMLDDVRKWQAQGLIEIEDAVVASAGPGGSIDIQQTHRSQKTRFALRGGGIGLLAGALSGGSILGLVAGVTAGILQDRRREMDCGLANDFVQAASQWVDPDRSALFLLVEEANVAKLRAKLKPVRAKLLSTTLAPEQELALRRALAEQECGA